ncbi:MAG TPA: hypothetical protein VHU88_15595 [Sporichthyaceae bacterium]|jgi:hypothetical protein|nr:hypothetical protein [Sporichthyaceae bacterium]
MAKLTAHFSPLENETLLATVEVGDVRFRTDAGKARQTAYDGTAYLFVTDQRVLIRGKTGLFKVREKTIPVGSITQVGEYKAGVDQRVLIYHVHGRVQLLVHGSQEALIASVRQAMFV